MKKIILRMVFLMTMLTLLFSDKVYAENYTENNKNSVVQVITVYKTEDNNLIALKSGSGIVVDSTTVITDYNLLHLSEKYLNDKKKDIKKDYGIELDFSRSDNIAVVVVDKGDYVIETTVMNESKDIGFSMLALSKVTERPSAVLGDSDSAVIASDVIIMGYPTIDKPKKGENIYLSVNDINLLPGVISEISNNMIRVGTEIAKGNTGGALVDKNTGAVIGMVVYNSDDKSKQCCRALPINVLKDYMGSVNYTDIGAMNQIAKVEVAEVADIPVDKSQLEQLILDAEKKDSKLYTLESYVMMQNCLEQAKTVMEKENVTQEEIDNTKELLNNSMNSLEEVSTFNWSLLIIIILAVIIIIIVTILIIVLVNYNKQKKEKDAFKTITDNAIYENPLANNNIANMNAGMNQNNFNTINPISGNLNKNNATTILNVSNATDEEGTTVLNAGTMQMIAYLIRKKNNESCMITGPEYMIGKDVSMVDYCISNNNAISRRHAKIIKRGVNYLLVDLKSTNYTYINNEQLTSEKEYILTSGDMIKFADEEFLFEIR